MTTATAAASATVHAADAAPAAGVLLFGAPFEFFLFAATLIGVAVFHHRVFAVALTGLAAIAAYKLFFNGFAQGPGVEGLAAHFWHERVILSNLFLLLVGFAVLSRHFEDSKAPDALPGFLPDNWTGGLMLLGLVFVLSAFLDNIAGALIGGVAAKHVFHGRVSVGYLAAIVAASNAGGSGSVVGDTTTTMMWIDGISPFAVLHAYIAAVAAFFVFAIPLSLKQHRYSPVQAHREGVFAIDWVRVGVVAFILLSAIAANTGANIAAPQLLDLYPVIGIAVWAAIAVASLVRRPDLRVAAASVKGSVFLLALVACASMMPVEALPPASWESALALGFISAVFDNIPLTALALNQGGYDWGVLAYAVGFGGSMVWFGSSAGVAISNMYPEAKSVFGWLRESWWIVVGYVVGFFVLLGVLGWHPQEPHRSVQVSSFDEVAISAIIPA
jgi:Na+/H+ antiporter NhaD/arsenite permease-like protein